MLVSVDE